MNIKEFSVETYMTDHENDCLYNLSDTCVDSLSIKDLKSDEDIIQHIMTMKMDYGPIVGSNRLKDGILSLYQTGDYDNIAITHGAINANELVMMTLLSPGDHVIAISPSYQQMYEFPLSIGCDVSIINLKEENNWLPSIEDFQQVMNKQTKLICLTSPNNPTGTTFDKDFMLSLIDLAKEYDCFILVDEIYRGINTKTKVLTPSFSDYYDKAIITSSLSKVFSFAGLRLGWIKGNKNIIDMINLRRDYHIISSGPLDDYLGSLVLENKDMIIQRSMDICEKNKAYIRTWLKNEPLVSCVLPDEGTVCFLHYHINIPSLELCERLQKETGVFFVPGHCFDNEYHLRFGFAQNYETIVKGLDIFSQWLHENA
ncbi:MAG: aminotransferase class I/II-fold pyridoxal phosphate-dependent enzyme [Erysipelotrichaceae bacterium]|nr:aminotransferase class I/II-fold pyridoxal phosphate-dependent enzyme [Erysipelotrichaceae bacterium]